MNTTLIAHFLASCLVASVLMVALTMFIVYIVYIALTYNNPEHWECKEEENE